MSSPPTRYAVCGALHDLARAAPPGDMPAVINVSWEHGRGTTYARMYPGTDRRFISGLGSSLDNARAFAAIMATDIALDPTFRACAMQRVYTAPGAGRPALYGCDGTELLSAAEMSRAIEKARSEEAMRAPRDAADWVTRLGWAALSQARIMEPAAPADADAAMAEAWRELARDGPTAGAAAAALRAAILVARAAPRA